MKWYNWMLVFLPQIQIILEWIFTKIYNQNK
jgi:hypothetical protein